MHEGSEILQGVLSIKTATDMSPIRLLLIFKLLLYIEVSPLIDYN